MAEDVWIFGYGSLVNAATHGYPETYPAHLTGWRRDWRSWQTGASKMSTVLTIEPEKDTTIAGLIARVPADRWQDLQNREIGYRFFPLDMDTIRHEAPELPQIMTFQSKSQTPGSVDHPIAQSYLDCVLQGFLNVFGEEAIDPFFETTAGWQTPVKRDRSDPIYPRAVTLSAQEQTLIDDMANKNGVQFL